MLDAVRPPVIESLPSLFAVPEDTAPVVAPKLHHAKVRPAKMRRIKRVSVRFSDEAHTAAAAAQIAPGNSHRIPHKRRHRLRSSVIHQRPMPTPIFAAIPVKEAAEPAAPHLRNPRVFH